MSYDICLVCDEMVSGYEKYCSSCLKSNNLKQDPVFWKSHHWYTEKTKMNEHLRQDQISILINEFMEENKDLMENLAELEEKEKQLELPFTKDEE